VLTALAPGTYDHIMVLAYREDLEAEAADAKTLVTLLLLREIADAGELDLSIVSEMLDDRNRKLAEVTKADDFIVSDNLMSLMMSQISENPDLSGLYSGLFAAEGAEIYLRPAEWYVALDTPVDFYTVAAGAAKRGETAIGFRDVTPTGSGDGQAAIRINPPKAAPHIYSAGDRIIVFAED
ncbi:MAG: potassium transporter TrkA, partial [Demequinaceae bacterium]|nr:potassium transporter TrkA [Demequinaceae bacterium]